MPQPEKLAKAKLKAITWDSSQKVQELAHEVDVQFNPETLKLAFANQNSGGDQRGGGSAQFVAKGTTKLSFDLWYDVSAPQPGDASETDVRKLTDKVNYFLRPNDDLNGAPPGVRFLWGTFLFEGVMESMNETLELFSEDGRPLRAMVSIGLAQQEIQFKFGEQSAAGIGNTKSPGTTPNLQARAGDSVQQMAARSGKSADWPQIALANGIENPRIVATGTLIRTRS